ncbi:glycosyltransferase [Nodularia sp. UHCC 0506]|uniref:glycosyltransferase n=1 Tax=Nodularia sp. UHCC 0506 TaxID=3110243 RepID=UPI002B20D840|nr:glycosyltransferase [Nodularia sp. UHCC 0506]MEA5515129.1 glycosyltransferase [Nodularia sp. UHCC 0506]
MASVSILNDAENFPGNSRSRLKKRTLLFRYLAEINLIFGAWYLHWRIANSINFDALWLAIPLLLAEIYTYFGGVLFVIGLWRPLVRQTKSLDQLTPSIPTSDWPTVDVFVTCYNEPPEIVEATAREALAMDYPIIKLRVYILDDGNSEEMRRMSERLCIEDLQSPLLQSEANRIDAERSMLLKRLEQLNNLQPDLKAAEQWLQDSSLAADNPTKSLNSLRQFILWLNIPDQTSIDLSENTIQARLDTEKQLLESAIYQKELELVELARLRYIEQPQETGGLNSAIFSGETIGDFILTLDADHIPNPQFLKRVLPYFFTYNFFSGKYEQNQIAFVQTPQDFYNIPSGDPFGHRASLFYETLQQGKDGMNAALYTGTNAILKREALISVGIQYFADEYAQDGKRLDKFKLNSSVSSNIITENINTSVRLHSAGWKSVYHNELLAKGLAHNDLSSIFQERLRWTQGTIQVLMKENPLTKSGLSFWQKLQYFYTMYSYFSGFATFIFILCPIIYFFTGIIPVKTFNLDFVLHFFPAFIINILTFLAASWGIPARVIWQSEQYNRALFPLLMQAVWNIFFRQPIKSSIQPKQSQSAVDLRLIWPQLVVFILTILGILWSFYYFATGAVNNPGIYLFNGAWAIYNLSLMWAIIHAYIWQSKTNS